MNKKFLTMVAALLVMSSVTVSAADKNTYKNQIQQNQYKLNGLTKDKKEVIQEKNTLNSELKSLIHSGDILQEDINSLSKSIEGKESSITAKILDIEEMTNKIQDLQKNIVVQMEKIKLQEEEFHKQEDQLGIRVRTAYKFNSIGSVLLVLAESESIIDFTERLIFIERMAEKDREVMELIQTLIKELDDKKVKLQVSKEESEVAKDNLDREKISLENEKASLLLEKTSISNKLESQNKLEEEKRIVITQMTAAERELSEAIGDIIEENEALEAEIQKVIKAEQEKARKEAERRAKEKAEKDKANQGSQSKPTSPPSNVNPSKGYIRPVAGRISSPYGNRIHPISGLVKMHTGIDLASPHGTGIKATKGGTIIVRKYNSSYGNYIVMDHGNGISSLYAHMSGFNVNYGDEVSQGQTIGFIGSTGSSTGPHLHFEIRVNGSHTNPMNYLN